MQPYASLFHTWSPNEATTVRPYVSLWNTLQLDDSVGASNHLVHRSARSIHAHECDHSRDAAALARLRGLRAHGHSGGGTYQFELMTGAVTQYNDFTLDLKYAAYGYPDSARSSLAEIGGKLSYDMFGLWSDPDPLRPISVRPYFAAFFETFDNTGGEDSYLELGVESSCRFELFGRQVGIGLPVRLGFSLDDYYFDADGSAAAFGFVSMGVSLSIPIMDEFGAWYLNSSIDYLHLAADNLAILNHGDRDQLIGLIGIGLSF